MAGADKILTTQAVKNPNFIYDLQKDLNQSICKH